LILIFAFSLPCPLAGADIFLAGDSTMASYPESRRPLTGWGMKLPELCKKGVRVYNFARNGASSQSFRDSFWQELISQVKPGDYVLIQFGHNDGFKKDTDPDTTFQDNLHFFIRAVRSKKAVPVLLTQTVICRFRDGKAFNKDVELPFIYATRKVAAEANVELIDHNWWALKKITALGRERAAKMYMNLEKGKYPAYPAGRVDNAHFQESGALFFASGVVEIAKSQNISVAKLFR
jgi:lysophospholipase L1-like esterase